MGVLNRALALLLLHNHLLLLKLSFDLLLPQPISPLPLLFLSLLQRLLKPTLLLLLSLQPLLLSFLPPLFFNHFLDSIIPLLLFLLFLHLLCLLQEQNDSVYWAKLVGAVCVLAELVGLSSGLLSNLEYIFHWYALECFQFHMYVVEGSLVLLLPPALFHFSLHLTKCLYLILYLLVSTNLLNAFQFTFNL